MQGYVQKYQGWSGGRRSERKARAKAFTTRGASLFSGYILYFRMVWDFTFLKSGCISQLKCIFHMLPGNRACYLKERSVVG